MISAHLEPGEPASSDPARLAGLLETGDRKLVVWDRTGDCLMCATIGRDDARRSNWTPGHATDGRLCLFNGRFHNKSEIAGQLGLPASTSDADCYAATVSRWGERADEHVNGHYCAICWLPGEQVLRLSRSPFLAPPLHFRAGGGWATASSVPRSLFWRDGAAREVDLKRLAHALVLDDTEPLRGWFRGCGRLPLGSVVMLEPNKARIVWRYDLFSRPQVRFARDEDYVEAARALLDEAVGHDLAGARQPGCLVTGGLDSAQVAASALLQLPQGQALHGFTYDPEPGAATNPGVHQYVGERAAVERFAALYPALKSQFFTNDGQDFRFGQRDLIRVMDCTPPSAALAWRLHGIFDAASRQGCDVILTGDFGNETFSAPGSWAYCEFLLTGRWVQLWRALKAHRNQTRSMPMRFLSSSVLPLLPGPLQRMSDKFRANRLPGKLERLGFRPTGRIPMP